MSFRSASRVDKLSFRWVLPQILFVQQRDFICNDKFVGELIITQEDVLEEDWDSRFEPKTYLRPSALAKIRARARRRKLLEQAGEAEGAKL